MQRRQIKTKKDLNKNYKANVLDNEIKILTFDSIFNGEV